MVVALALSGAGTAVADLVTTPQLAGQPQLSQQPVAATPAAAPQTIDAQAPAGAAAPIVVPTRPLAGDAAPVPPAAAAAAEPEAQDDPDFPHLPVLRGQVAFWTKVFSEYSENQSVVHSIVDVRKVYKVLDFSDDALTMNSVQLSLYKGREEARAKEDINELLKRVDELQNTPDQMDAEEHRVYEMYSDSTDPHRFRNAIGTFRVQRGLRERTAHALQVSGRYLSQMEQVFASYGLPVKLTRLPLVESSFNLTAYSKDGAAGLWQFMPASARIYMHLDEIADDRRDPWFSTDAAARHLRDDYNALQTWPLAVTAYNVGRGGVSRRLQAINGTSLTDLVEHYGVDDFGFASRNFYAEFLAASDVERDWRKHFGDIQRDSPTQFETVETRDYVPYATLQRLSGADETTFRTLNPSYNDQVVDGHLYVPPGQLIRVPAGSADRFKLQYASLDTGERFEHQRQFYTLHRLRRGESLARLARRYGVTEAAIRAANGLGPHSRLRAGNTLRIPPHDAPSTVVASADQPEAHVVKTVAHSSDRKAARLRLHKVRSGQTLGEIARRYQVSVSALRHINGLSSDRLRVGALLKIPNE